MVDRYRLSAARNPSARVLVLGLAFGLALGLGGCSGADPEPRVQPSGSGSASITAPTSPTRPTEPTLPQVARKPTVRGARAFVVYWVDLVNYAQATGETTRLAQVSDDRCTGCFGVVEAIQSPYSRGGRIEGGEWVIGRLRPLPLDYDADWAAYAPARSSEQTVVDGKNHETVHSGGDFGFFAYVVNQEDGWRMRWLRTPS